MLTAFAAGMTQLGWMVGLTLAMVAERDQSRLNHAAALVGVALLALAAGIVVASVRGSPNLFATRPRELPGPEREPTANCHVAVLARPSAGFDWSSKCGF